METTPVFIGIDVTAGRRPMNYAVLDEARRVVACAAGDLEVVLGAVAAYPAAVVAVDAPQSPNGGLMADAAYRAALAPAPAGSKYAQAKVCEYQLLRRGIKLYLTPRDEAAARPWMQMGFEVYRRLRALGYELYWPGSAAPRQMLEVHPHASFAVLLGRLPLPKDTLEGRLQRQMVLYRQRVGVRDPMSSLEEITPHSLLEGALRLPGLHTHDELDALAAAYTAYVAATLPDQATRVGDEDEGQIVVPVAAEKLKERYAR